MVPTMDKSPDQLLGSILRRKEFWFSCVFGLHLIILVHAAQWFMYAVFAGKSPQTILYLRWAISLWYTRAALAPPAVWIALRYRFQPERWYRYLAIYCVTCVVLAVAASALQSVVVMRLESGKVFSSSSGTDADGAQGSVHLTRFQDAVIKGWPKLVYNMFTCWMLIALVQGIIYYEDARERQIQALQLETKLATVSLRALRMQLNPHFLFNTLHAISTLIEEEPRVAEEMLLRLSHLLRSILDEDNAEITLHKELSFLEDYLAIEQVRFGDRLTVNIDVDSVLLDCAVPQLVLQPLVENVIRHGIGRNAGRDSIRIRAFESLGLLHIEIQNDNSTLEQASDTAGHVGIGLSNTVLRLKTLYDDRCSLGLSSLLPSGVSVTITLPAHRLGTLRHEPQEVGVG